MGDAIYKLLSIVDLSSEQIVVEIVNKLETTIYICVPLCAIVGFNPNILMLGKIFMYGG